MKNLAIIGATGSTGKELLKLAIQKNYDVTIIARKPELLKPIKNTKIVNGDVTDLKSLVNALENIDFVISCFGPTNHKKVGNLMSLGTKNIVEACKKNEIKRFVFMSGFVQSDSKNFSILNRLAIKLLRIYYKESFEDKVIAESLIQKSKLNWVIVRAVALTDKIPKGEYKAGTDLKVSPFNALTYVDCATCLLDAIDETAWTNTIVNG